MLLGYRGQLKGDFYETYEVTVKEPENETVYYKENSGVSAPNILFRKSGKSTDILQTWR
jgi:hypothetical protein